MAITYVDGIDDFTSQPATDNGITMALDTISYQANDLALLIGSNARFNDVHAATATGYTSAGFSEQTAGTDTRTDVLYKVLSGSESNPTIDWATAGDNSNCAALLMVFRGVDTTTPIDVTATTSVGANNANPTPPAITPVTDNGALVIVTGHERPTSTTISPPSTPTSLVAGAAQTQYTGFNKEFGAILISCYKADYGTAATITPTAWQQAIVYYQSTGTLTQANFDGVGGNGTYAGGSNYAVSETLTMSNGCLVTVDTVDGGGAVTGFSISRNDNPMYTSNTATITYSSGSTSGTGFSITWGTNNLASATGSETASLTIALRPAAGGTSVAPLAGRHLQNLMGT